MATTTPNYGWTVPTSTDLVKDGATAIETLGDAVDATVFANANAAITKTIVDAKGDLIAATAADTVSRLAVGANDTVLTADSSTATGLKWAAPAGGGGMTLISTTTFNAQSITLSSIPQTYKSLYITIENLDDSNGTTPLQMRVNGVTTGNVYFWGYQSFADTTSSNNSSTYTFIKLTTSLGNNASVAITIPEYATVTRNVIYNSFAWNNGSYCGRGTAMYDDTAAITSITLFRPDAGTFDGTIKLYGVN